MHNEKRWGCLALCLNSTPM